MHFEKYIELRSSAHCHAKYQTEGEKKNEAVQRPVPARGQREAGKGVSGLSVVRKLETRLGL